jgi:hypothetical protein
LSLPYPNVVIVGSSEKATTVQCTLEKLVAVLVWSEGAALYSVRSTIESRRRPLVGLEI